MSSRISGLGLTGIAARVTDMHRKAYETADAVLPVGGSSVIAGPANDMLDGQLIRHAAGRDTGSYESWKKYSALVGSQGLINLRDLMISRPATR